MINWNAFHRAVYHLISEHLFVKLKNYQNYQQTIKKKKGLSLRSRSFSTTCSHILRDL